jgi:hypothetical protein
MVLNYCELLSRPISIRLFDSDLTWLSDHMIERNEFIRNLVHTRVSALKQAARCSTDQSVPIMNIFSKGQNLEKSEQAAPLDPLRAFGMIQDPMSLGDTDMIERNIAWSEETAFMI